MTVRRLSWRRCCSRRIFCFGSSGAAVVMGDFENTERVLLGALPRERATQILDDVRFTQQLTTDRRANLAFVAGHPGRTSRLFTLAHLEYLRDVSFPLTLELLKDREAFVTRGVVHVALWVMSCRLAVAAVRQNYRS